MKTFRRRGAAIAAVLAAVASAALVSGAAPGFSDRAAAAAPVAAVHPTCASAITSGPVDVTINPGNFLGGWGTWATGTWLCSPTGRWVAGMQLDGNFVGYDMSTTPGAPLWNTWTFGVHVGGKAAALQLRASGDLVLVDAVGATLRSTGTAGVPTPVTVRLDDAGTLTLVDATGTVRFTSAGTERISCLTPGVFTCDPYTVR